jgi:hypothetical protein
VEINNKGGTQAAFEGQEPPGRKGSQQWIGYYLIVAYLADKEIYLKGLLKSCDQKDKAYKTGKDYWNPGF